MKLKLITVLLVVLSTACSQNKKKEIQEKKHIKNTIFIQLKNIPFVSDTLKLQGNKLIINREPFLSYKVKNNFIKNIINIEKGKKKFSFNIDEEDNVFLKVRYNFNKFKVFVLIKGDSVNIEFKNGEPIFKLLNRLPKKYDYSLSTFFNKYRKPLDFSAFLKEHNRFRNIKEEESYNNDIQSALNKQITGIDSLKRMGQLSSNVYEYKRKSIFYMQKRHNIDIEKIIKGNNDLHIDTYTRMLINYVSNNISKKLVKVSNGFVINSLESFDYVMDNRIFENESKDFLLWHFIKGIAIDFSVNDFNSRYSKFSKAVTNLNLVNEIKNEYLVDYSGLNKKTDEVVLINIGKKKNNLKKIIEENKGKIIFIDFWASWCAPCRTEIPHSKKIIQEYKNKNVVFLFISIDKSFKNWQKALKDENLFSYKYNYLAINYPNAVFFKELNLKSIPRYILFDKKGKLVHKNAPSPSSDEIKVLLNEYINK